MSSSIQTTDFGTAEIRNSPFINPDIQARLRSVNPLVPLPGKLEILDATVAHAPKRNHGLSVKDQKLAVANALRYFPPDTHAELATEFALELKDFGHIYMYRLMPKFALRAYPIEEIPAKTVHGAVIIHMICNNLDPAVAQFPQELVTYGGNGQVFSNWAQVSCTFPVLLVRILQKAVDVEITARLKL